MTVPRMPDTVVTAAPSKRLASNWLVNMPPTNALCFAICKKTHKYNDVEYCVLHIVYMLHQLIGLRGSDWLVKMPPTKALCFEICTRTGALAHNDVMYCVLHSVYFVLVDLFERCSLAREHAAYTCTVLCNLHKDKRIDRR